ncbi:SH3 domain-containing protein [Anaeromyxobacter oryzae]|uniref:SH3b domain-containing protein n=1 Tax=Anaeromyxobacter oryzae TaxID=2918170 RepID=A0ABM7WVX1_9BACT|nr:SH3 domain-containing protein [Anaeromyxobacter oryzae]BDG03655.1 hypothetical protein AMOR_26510 [Anaeromyxobacter oryzae]
MTSILARAALLAALLSVTGCRSAFAPESVVRMTTQAATVPATTSREVVLRTGPDLGAHILATLPAGAAVTSAEQASRGFRRVKTADGKTGFVEDSALVVGGAAAAAPAPAQQGEPPAASSTAQPSPQG